MEPNMSVIIDIDASPAIKKLMALKNQAPKKYSCRFIEPGIVSYEDSGAGKAFLGKEALEKFIYKFEGKPVVMEGSHRDDVDENSFDAEGVGIIGKVWFNDKDGWYWADTYIWGEQAQKLADKGYPLSCAYTVTETGDGGTRNQIEYDSEILNGEPKHLALVSNPRYEGAKIILNYIIGGSSMKIKGWFKKLVGKDVKNAVDPEKSLVNVDGEKVPLKNLMQAFQDDAADKKKLEDEKNAAAGDTLLEEELGEDSTVEVDGNPVKISDMMNAYRNKCAAVKKNAEEKEKKEKENAKALEGKETPEEEELEKKNAAEAEAKKKEEEEKKNAAEKEEKEKADKEKKNSFTELKNSVKLRDEQGIIVEVNTIEEKRAKGKDLFGSK